MDATVDTIIILIAHHSLHYHSHIIRHKCITHCRSLPNHQDMISIDNMDTSPIGSWWSLFSGTRGVYSTFSLLHPL